MYNLVRVTCFAYLLLFVNRVEAGHISFRPVYSFSGVSFGPLNHFSDGLLRFWVSRTGLFWDVVAKSPKFNNGITPFLL